MNRQHTQGPWKVILSDNATPHIMHGDGCYIEERDKLVCIMPAEITMPFNSLNNARLIAAAPEMLKALEIIANGGEGQFQWSMIKAEALARKVISNA